MSSPSWSITNHGGVLHIDDYLNMPTGTIAAIDIETNGKEVTDNDFRIVCIGICDNQHDAFVYFDIRPSLLDYLRRVQIIAHDGKSAEIPWLAKYGVTIEQLYFDTKTGYYVYDSARKNFALKPILKDVFQIEYPTYEELTTDDDTIAKACYENPSLLIQGKKGIKFPRWVTLDQIPKDMVAEYNACDVFWTYRLWIWIRQQYSVAQTNFFETIEMPETRLIYYMENKGIKIDTKSVRKIHNETSKLRRKVKSALFALAGARFNPNSPQQVLPLLQGRGLDVEGTSEDVLVSHKADDFVQKLLEYRGYQKICSTYTIPLYFSAIKATDSRIHAHFSQNTITGRLSSSDPVNLQNQPQEVRKCFVSEEGYTFLDPDWSNIELRLPAHFSGEPKFIEELSKLDGDLHTRTANFIFHTDITLLTEEERKAKRKVAKTCNFLLTNSGTPFQLSIELGCTFKEAEEIYRLYWLGYPTLANWLKEEKRRARINGGITSWFGRWVAIPQLRLICNNPGICGSHEWHFRKCKNCIVREEAERSAMSILVQGTAADMAKMAGLRIYKEFGYIPVNFVHDELLYEIPNDQVEIAKERIKHVMENIVTLKVPLVVDLKTGTNWKSAKDGI